MSWYSHAPHVASQRPPQGIGLWEWLHHSWQRSLGILFVALLWLAACDGKMMTNEPNLGDSEFLSAAGSSGGAYQGGRDGALAGEPSANEDNGESRTVEEGDIYRVLSPNRLLNLNSYRGLQVIDLTDPEHPTILGKVAVSGYTVEMYVVGTRAYVLLNNWYGYYGSRRYVAVEPYYGGLVLAVDFSDPTNPVITGRARVPGWIQASRLTRGGGKEALYVAAGKWDGGTNTVVRSFSVSAEGKLEERSTIDLGGYVVDIQATPAALLVARSDWTGTYGERTLVAVIDISDTEGTMVEGASVPVAGRIKNKTNMDLRGNILRIASGSVWGGASANSIETFNVSDIHNPVPVDVDTFGAGEDLYATIFLPNKAFCVTYRQTDPFHAFEISDTGEITPRSEFVISGWNDFFQAVFDETRLVGIGVDDENGRKLAASLYDITDLTNPNPFIARASIEFDYSWSEAQWDNRAFSVLENAVSVPGPGGVTETGLILLPFTGYSSTGTTYQAGVQIFTFSPTTLTKRGVMDHGSPVRRSFVPREHLTANISERRLSLFETSSPDTPVALGTLDLAPSYTDFFVFGNYGARLKNESDEYRWWGSQASTLPPNQLQIIPLGGDPDTATPVATVAIPTGARVYQVGSLAVAVLTEYVENSDPPAYSSKIKVIDLADPTHPVERGTTVTDQILPSWGPWYGPWEGCWDCGCGGYCGRLEAYALGTSLVFVSRVSHAESLGWEHVCSSYPEDRGTCWLNESGTLEEGCTYYRGGITCRRLDGGRERCEGFVERCTYEATTGWECTQVDPSSVPMETNCYDQERVRYWNSFGFAPLDLANPDAPVMRPTVAMPEHEQDVSVVANGTGLYVTHMVPVSVPGDHREYVRYYFKKVDFAVPQHPRLGPSINIPGELILVDGSTIYTRDFVWSQHGIESAVNRLSVIGNKAYLQARRRFYERDVYSMLLDGAGHILVSHGPAWWMVPPGGDTSTEFTTRLSILNTEGSDFPVLSDVAVDSWAELKEARLGRALFMVPGGILVLNVEDATTPHPQAYFATQGWPQRLVVAGTDMYLPAGPYGLYRFPLGAYNLIETDQ